MDRCIMCGAPVPEGRQVCGMCEAMVMNTPIFEKPKEEVKTQMTIKEFSERLKADGFYIGSDNHVHYPNGKPASRMIPNGYYMVRKMYNNHCFYFMEHRVIWCMTYGDIDDNLVINHKDCDRANNAIDNLELVTQKRNMEYANELGRTRYLKGEESPRAYLCKSDVHLIRHLVKVGYSQEEIAKMYGFKHANMVSRVVTGARYGNITDQGDISTLYPQFVLRTARLDMNDPERITDGVMGLCGEAGEVCDLVKKWRFQGHDLDVNHVVSELGDCLYYLTWIAITLGVDIEEIMFDNARKLYERYPDGFNMDRSVNRKEGDI